MLMARGQIWVRNNKPSKHKTSRTDKIKEGETVIIVADKNPFFACFRYKDIGVLLPRTIFFECFDLAK